MAEGTLDGELAALLWLLVQGSVPLIVTGEVDHATHAAVAAALLGAAPAAAVAIIDADRGAPPADVLGSHLQAGTRVALTVHARDLGAAMEALSAPPRSLPEDAVRRLGLVMVLADESTLRAAAVHYLRPTERDAQGHLQRRPHAVLATWDPTAGAFDHFAWGVMPELADRIDRSRSDLERRQASRAVLLAHLAHGDRSDPTIPDRLAHHVAAEPPREPAPVRRAASPLQRESGPGQPHIH